MSNHTTSSAVVCARVQNSRSTPVSPWARKILLQSGYRQSSINLKAALVRRIKAHRPACRSAEKQAQAFDLLRGYQESTGQAEHVFTYDTWAELLGCGRAQARRVIADLVSIDLLIAVKGNGRSNWSTYAINWQVFNQLPYEVFNHEVDKMRKMSTFSDDTPINALKPGIINLTAGAELSPAQDTSRSAASKDNKQSSKKSRKLPESTRALYNLLTDGIHWDSTNKARTYGCLSKLVNEYGAERVDERLQYAIELASCGEIYMLDSGAIFHDWLCKGLERGYGLADEEYYGGNRYKDEQPTGILPELAASLTANSYTARYEDPAPRIPAKIPATSPGSRRAELVKILDGLADDSPARASIAAELASLE